MENGIEISLKIISVFYKSNRIIYALVTKVKEKKMVNKRFWLGMLVMVLMFGMTVVGCDNGTTNDNGDDELPFLGGWSVSGDIVTPKVGGALTINTENIVGTGAINIRWFRGNNPITGATNSSYTLVDIDTDQLIKFEITRTGYRTATWTSRKILPFNAPSLSGIVTITGTAKVRQTLIADTSGISGNGTIEYLWFREAENNSFRSINGATSASYTLTTDDLDKKVHVLVIREGFYGSITSNNSPTIQ